METEFVTDGEERKSACDLADQLVEAATGDLWTACEAVIYAYRFDGIMTRAEVDALKAATTDVKEIGGGWYEAADGTTIYSP
jgi:hypothetical protein